MPGAKFTLDPKGVADLLNGPEAKAHVEAVAAAGAAEAARIAPARTGHYRGSLVSSSAESTSQGAKATFGSTDFAWHLVEFGSINNSPYRVLTRAAMSLGLTFKDTGG